MRIFALVLAVLPTAAVRLGGAPAMQVYTPLIAPERRPLIAGNWKLNPETAGEAAALLKLVAANQRAMETSGRRDVPDVALFPPFPFLPLALELLRGTSVKVGAQNIGLQTKGAFTGEVSASQVASLGCECVLLGHSERRALFDEDDETINAKVHLALGSGLKVVLCVGETQAEYEMELVGAVCEAQLKKGLKDVSAADAERIVVAYEPVWAIGTGLVATPEQAQAAHAVIRRVLGEIYGDETARRIVIQYGGSVTPESIDELIRMPDIDGALVGGASLVADKFSRICEFTPPTRPRESPRVVTAREVVSCKNTLGESPVWSARDGRLHWVSAPDSEVWSWDLRSPPWKCSFAPQTVGCCALKAGGGLLVALEEQIVGLDVDTRQVDDLGIRTPEPQRTTRLNDGRVDRSGNFVVGMYNLYHRAGASGGDDNAGPVPAAGRHVERGARLLVPRLECDLLLARRRHGVLLRHADAEGVRLRLCGRRAAAKPPPRVHDARRARRRPRRRAGRRRRPPLARALGRRPGGARRPGDGRDESGRRAARLVADVAHVWRRRFGDALHHDARPRRRRALRVRDAVRDPGVGGAGGGRMIQN